MKITSEIKTMDEFKKLPLICKMGIIIFYLGGISFIISVLFRMFYFLIIPYAIPISIGSSLFGILITIVFDKDRKKEQKSEKWDRIKNVIVI